MRRRRVHISFVLAAVGIVYSVAGANGCAHAPNSVFTTTSASTTTTGDPPTSATTGAGGAPTTSAGHGGFGVGGLMLATTGTGGSGGAVMANPCGSKCGPVELCDPDHLGLDDNCNGLVDEGCPCSAGQAHACFKGDPSYHGMAGCFDGTEKCTEQGLWGPCIGGFHAVPPDSCNTADPNLCHPISAAPFADVHLKVGTGSFSANAVPGSEVWTVTCPQGVSPCPGVSGMNPADVFKPLQSGEYKIAYTKGLAGAGVTTCSYSLFVGAPGLRVELTWEHTSADSGVDLDLHVHKPNNTKPWGISPGVPEDCCWSNCTFMSLQPPAAPGSPSWFGGPPDMPPKPVNWWVDPLPQKNTCYFAPAGVGAEWKALGIGCHNPRLDLDNISCDFSVSDVNDPKFCAPENMNIDFPPQNEWVRVGVHYYSNHQLNYDVHPSVRVYCDGALGAELGASGYYSPQAPVTFSPADGGNSPVGNRFWMVADVAFKSDACHKSCIVKPIYSDAATKAPFFTVDSSATTIFAPSYPPLP